MTRATMLKHLAPGRRVECNVRGRIFWATLVELLCEGQWRIQPPKGISYYHVNLRQIRNIEKTWTPDDSQVRKSG